LRDFVRVNVGKYTKYIQIYHTWSFWEWGKLAHGPTGHELYLIPTGAIAVVFATELLSQLRNRSDELERVAQLQARHDGKTLDKTANTRYAAEVIAMFRAGFRSHGPRFPTPNHSEIWGI
jgi:hypothetical protein